MSVVLHIPCRRAQAYGDAKDSNLGEPGKDINICLKFCLKTFVMLPIPKVLRHTVMPVARKRNGYKFNPIQTQRGGGGGTDSARTDFGRL